ncbi:MAG: AsmA-like C-terminal region-containing protein, partial [Bacteroidota bacterium]
NNEFGITGTVKQSDKFSDYDLKITSEEGTLTSVLQLLPEEYMAYLGDFSSTGNFLFNADITGRAGIDESPGFVANIELEDGRITSPRLQNDLKDVSFRAVFSNGAQRNNRSSYFRINDLKGYFNRELVELDFELRNLDDPNINMTLDGVVPLGAIYELLGTPAITDGDGEIEIKQFKLKGRYEDMIDARRIGRVQASGQLEFDDAALTINDEEVILDQGDLILSDNTLTVKDLEFNGAGSEIYVDGSFYNIIPVLLADSLNTKNSELKFTAKLDAPQMDLARLISLTDIAVEENTVSTFEYDSLQVEHTEQREFITKFLKGTFDARVEAFSYHLIEGEDFKGNLDFDNNEMTIKGSTQAMDGTIDLDGTMFFEKKPYLKAKFIAKDIDFKAFFRQSENFGQEVLVHENIGGRLDTKMLIDAYFDQQGNFLYDQLYVLAGVAIRDGELVDFEMLEEFSTYVKIDDLKHIKFTNEQNYLEIKNENIHIPVMFIQSNALNLTLGGDHSFENEFDYNMKINAGQVVANRFKRYNPNQIPQKAKRKGWFNIYYKVFGNLDDYQYESARREIKRDFAQSEQRKRIIKAKLAQAFGAVDFLEEPKEWDDVPSASDDDEEYLGGFDDTDGK